MENYNYQKNTKYSNPLQIIENDEKNVHTGHYSAVKMPPIARRIAFLTQSKNNKFDNSKEKDIFENSIRQAHTMDKSGKSNSLEPKKSLF